MKHFDTDAWKRNAASVENRCLDNEERTQHPQRPGFPVCDWRPGCAIINDAFPEQVDVAQAALQTTPHLAEALVALGLPLGREAVDMALALQEARHVPPLTCSCLALATRAAVAED